MADYSETGAQVRPGVTRTPDSDTDPTSAATDSSVRSNGSGQRIDQYRAVVESPPRRASDRKTDVTAPFRKSVAREYFESAVVTFVMALFGMTFIVQAVKVPTGSMKNTIYIGDHLLVNKFLFGPEDGIKLPILPDREIRRGDVIVFKYPKKPDVNYVKRVIGLPGDTVEYNSESNRVYINGQELPEHRVWAASQKEDEAGPLTVTNDEARPQGAWYT